MIGLVGAGLQAGLIPKKETLDSNLPTEVTDRLKQNITNVKWDKDVDVIDEKIIQATLCYDKDGANECITRTLSVDQESERTYCINETLMGCEEYGLQDLAEFINEKMVEQADKVMMYRYKEFEDTKPIPEIVDVGEKTINLNN